MNPAVSSSEEEPTERTSLMSACAAAPASGRHSVATSSQGGGNRESAGNGGIRDAQYGVQPSVYWVKYTDLVPHIALEAFVLSSLQVNFIVDNIMMDANHHCHCVIIIVLEMTHLVFFLKYS